MGIKGLWSVLTPFCEKKSLHEISGETVAVDLAGWVCDSQHAVDPHAQPKLYLRNLFFRTSYLLLADVEPLFVLDGDAPELKRDELERRRRLRLAPAAPAPTAAPSLARARLRGMLRECEVLLGCMGVSCVRGRGEAEATCAYLNQHKVAAAVVSQDSDCFAYGARRVYRNFSVSRAAGGGSLHGSVHCYDAERLREELGFGRNKMVALALLCGSDYGTGAAGSPVATALAFLHTLADDEVIPRLQAWSAERAGPAARAGEGAARGRCALCPSCSREQHKEERSRARREATLRARAAAAGASGEPFPSARLLHEFLRADHAPLTPLAPPALPDLLPFVRLMRDKLGWTERYSVEKLLPLLTRRLLRTDPPSSPRATPHGAPHALRPVRILRKCKPRGVPSVEVQWEAPEGEYDALVPDDQLRDGEVPEVVWRTVEPAELVQRRHPDLLAAYLEQRGAAASTRRRRAPATAAAAAAAAAAAVAPDDLADRPAHKLKRKVKPIRTQNKAKKTVDSFVIKKKRKKNSMQYLRDSFNRMSLCENTDPQLPAVTSEQKESENCATGSDRSTRPVDAEDEEFAESDLSGLVERIVTRDAATRERRARLGTDSVKLIFTHKCRTSTPKRGSASGAAQRNCSTPISTKSDGGEAREAGEGGAPRALDTSYFFDDPKDESDLFELFVDSRNLRDDPPDAGHTGDSSIDSTGDVM